MKPRVIIVISLIAVAALLIAWRFWDVSQRATSRSIESVSPDRQLRAVFSSGSIVDFFGKHNYYVDLIIHDTVNGGHRGGFTTYGDEMNLDLDDPATQIKWMPDSREFTFTAPVKDQPGSPYFVRLQILEDVTRISND